MGMLIIARLGCLGHLSSRQGKYPKTCRWFQDIDSAAFLLDHRHAKGLLIDVAIMCQNASPYQHQIDFADKLSVLFVKEHGASLQVASHLLRDAKMWQVIIRQNIITQDAHRIKIGKIYMCNYAGLEHTPRHHGAVSLEARDAHQAGQEWFTIVFDKP